ncbi:hypothetical protein C2S51_017578 [Perilla frutescens var. frutescens]|nr:hypothetical protein C2S51_017578 [Perilla frutescens var. frutescens]
MGKKKSSQRTSTSAPSQSLHDNTPSRAPSPLPSPVPSATSVSPLRPSAPLPSPIAPPTAVPTTAPSSSPQRDTSPPSPLVLPFLRCSRRCSERTETCSPTVSKWRLTKPPLYLDLNVGGSSSPQPATTVPPATDLSPSAIGSLIVPPSVATAGSTFLSNHRQDFGELDHTVATTCLAYLPNSLSDGPGRIFCSTGRYSSH